MKRKNNSKGITLIALIISIVILLILATVTIRSVSGDGILSNASNAKEKYKQEQYKEIVQLALNEAKITTINNKSGFLAEVKRILENDPAFENATFGEIENEQFTIQTKEQYSFIVRKNGVVNSGYEGESEVVLTTRYDVTEDEYGCTNQCTITVRKQYESVVDYWKKEKVSAAQYESFLWNLYGYLKGNSAMQTALLTNGGSVENVPISEIQNALNDEDDPIIVAAIMYLIEYDTDLKVQGIIDGWKANHTESTASSVNDVLGEYLQPGLTLESATQTFQCSENTIVDYLARNIMLPQMTTSNLFNDINAKYNVYKTEFNQESILGPDVTIQMPDGTQKTGNTKVTYIALDNGVYTFSVTDKGQTKDYTVRVEGISHHCIENATWTGCNDGFYHKTTCPCNSHEVKEEHRNGNGVEMYSSNHDGTHKVYYICAVCGEEVVIRETEVCYQIDGVCTFCGN